jgi:hypothetical protein
MKKLIYVAVGAVVLYWLYKKFMSPEGKAGAIGRRSVRSGVQKAGGTGTFECPCRNKYGQITWQRSCRRSQFSTCQECCDHYGKDFRKEDLGW